MEKLYLEFTSFMKVIESRLSELGLSLNSFPVDHICYRVNSLEDYKYYKELFVASSLLYTEKFFHERSFHTFVLKEPLTYEDLKIPYLEFAEPGGSDTYERGFQHIEFISNKRWNELVSPTLLATLLYTSKHGEEYLKWDDKLVVKVTDTPQITKALLEDSPTIVLNSA